MVFKLLRQGKEEAKKLNKRDDLNRAALIAMAAVYSDGEAGEKEVLSAENIIHSMFDGIFRRDEVTEALSLAEAAYAGGLVSARLKTRRACEGVESPTEAEALFAVGADVCASEGDIGEKEDKWLRTWLAPNLKVKAENLLG